MHIYIYIKVTPIRKIHVLKNQPVMVEKSKL